VETPSGTIAPKSAAGRRRTFSALYQETKERKTVVRPLHGGFGICMLAGKAPERSVSVHVIHECSTSGSQRRPDARQLELHIAAGVHAVVYEEVQISELAQETWQLPPGRAAQ
jgi:hypothetical protein